MPDESQPIIIRRDSALQSVTQTIHDNTAALVYLARLAPGSRRTMRAALDCIAGLFTNGREGATTLAWQFLRYEHTQAIRARLAERYAPATANKMLAALRGVLRECWRLGQMDVADYHRAIDLAAVKGSTMPRGRGLAAGELRALFVECATDNSISGHRDAALLAVLYGAGLRRSEAVAFNVSDYDVETGALRVRSGKGRKARTAYATGGAKQAIEAWLDARATTPQQPDAANTDAGESLFCPINKGGKLTLRRMSDQAVLNIVRKRALRSGVKMFSPHDLRRSFISDLLDAGADISTVQGLAGHANVQTTARYDRRGERTKRKAAEMLHVPYKK